MIIWLNGPHGIGKTTTATLLAERIHGARIFDPEYVGVILRPTLAGIPVSDFREWPPWRAMVARAATSIHEFLVSGRSDAVLLMPQTVPEQAFWHEIRAEIDAARIELVHITLIADVDEHQRRIAGDTVESPEVAKGRASKIMMFRAALGWLEQESTVINTTGLTPDQVVDQVNQTAGLA